MKKLLIILLNVILLLLMINNSVNAYTTSRYLDTDKIMECIYYDGDNMVKSFKSQGYTLLKNGSCGAVSQITSDAIQKKAYETIASWGYVVDGTRSTR